MKFKFTLELLMYLLTLLNCIISSGAYNMTIPMLLVSVMCVRLGYEAHKIWHE
ncbi:hypothetical protein ACWO4B_003201 [Clostridium sporogenes]